MGGYAALIHGNPKAALPYPLWKRALGKIAAVLRNRSPRLAGHLARIRRKVLPGLYPSTPADVPRDEPGGGEGVDGFAFELPTVAAEGPPGGVVHYIGSLNAGGAERQVVYSTAGLLRTGVPAALLVSEGLGGSLGHYLPQATDANVDVRCAGERIDRRFLEILRRRPELSSALERIPAYLRPRVTDAVAEFIVLRPQIVHCWLDHSNIWGGLAAIIAGVEHVVLSTRNVSPVHFPHLLQPWFRDWYRWLLAKPGVVMMNNSQPGARDYAEWLDYPAERIHVILNGVDLAMIRRPADREVDAARRVLADSPGQRIVIGIARLSDEKQPEVFVEVARRVLERRSDVTFALIGTGVLETEVRRQIRRLGLSRRVRLLGRRSDVPALISASDVFLLTSRAEGTPNVLLEAQTLGCPPVSTRAGGAADSILDGETGFLADVGDVETLTDRILNLLSDEPLRCRMAERGPALVAERFGLQRMIDETVSLYRTMDPSEVWRSRSGGW